MFAISLTYLVFPVSDLCVVLDFSISTTSCFLLGIKLTPERQQQGSFQIEHKEGCIISVHFS